jgi:hypothetical protein
MAQACHPSYLGGGDQKDLGSRPAWAKRSQDPISANKLSVMVCTCHLSSVGGASKRILVQASLCKKHKILSEKMIKVKKKKKKTGDVAY